MRSAVVLLSGGLDSTVTAAQAIADGFELHALTVAYGQRHARELEAARAVASALGAATHTVLDVDLAAFGGSALTDEGIPVPLDRDESRMASGIPPTYVPARNTVLLALALALAEARDADAIYIGANAVDYSGYPDCRPEFLEQFERTANLGTKRGVEGRPFRIVAPLVRLTKADIVRLGAKLKAPFGLTWSCYL
ncbi:MAG: 7-cyano-7-deazaguanine synthase QueC, partial [bacterium]